jgi:hypothetical protein
MLAIWGPAMGLISSCYQISGEEVVWKTVGLAGCQSRRLSECELLLSESDC